MPRILDLFCCEGGAGMGYQLAGFEVTGVDNRPQPRYPFEVIHADAIDLLSNAAFLDQFDAIHASPPCQAYSRATMSGGGVPSDHPDLVAPVRQLLMAQPRPWIIENVPLAPVRPDYILCGSQFGLRVRRHRWFETSWRGFSLIQPCAHPADELPFIHKDERAYADELGGYWMSNKGGRQAIPPAYTEYLGTELLAVLEMETTDAS